jgi:hypothetical protein
MPESFALGARVDNGATGMKWINLDLVLGILIGLATSLLFASPWHWEHGLRDKEFVVGILSLAGAAGAILAVMRQVAHAQEMEDERRARQNFAARSMMPHALTSLCRYARACGQFLQGVVQEQNGPAPHDTVSLPVNLDIPILPDDVFKTLQGCIEFGRSDLQKRLAELIGALQVQNTRLNDPDELFDGGRISGDWFYTLVADTIEIYARSTMLFDYGRRETETAPEEPRLRDMLSACHLCSFDDVYWPHLHEKLQSGWK